MMVKDILPSDSDTHISLIACTEMVVGGVGLGREATNYRFCYV